MSGRDQKPLPSGGGAVTSDAMEAWANAIAGLAISWALIAALRAAGAWDAPAPVVSALFFTASVARSYGLRRVFRRVGQ